MKWSNVRCFPIPRGMAWKINTVYVEQKYGNHRERVLGEDEKKPGEGNAFSYFLSASPKPFTLKTVGT